MTQTSLASTDGFGPLLKHWRQLRKFSQLALSMEAEVSQRHLSFMESGRAQPSREMVLQLCEALDIPLRDRNALLVAAGYSPLYRERDLNDADMAALRKALDLTLNHHDPYPALVVDGHWNLLQQNRAADAFLALLGEPDSFWPTIDPSGQRNIMRLSLHPKGLQPSLRNWEVFSAHLLSRLQRDLAASPGNAELQQLYEDVCAYPGVAEGQRVHVLGNPAPLLAMEINLGEHTLSVFSMISAFGTAQDITAEEVRIETFFPADEFSEQFLKSLV